MDIQMNSENSTQIAEPVPGQVKANLKVTQIILIILLCFIVFGIGGFYLGKNYKNQELAETARVSSPTPTPSPVQVTKETPESHSIDTIGLSYQLPDSFSNLGVLSEQIIPGEQGNMLCVTYPKKSTSLIGSVYAGGTSCDIVQFGFGTTTTNFEAGRSGGFTDFQGYEMKDGTYFGRFPGNKSIEIPEGIIEVFENTYGVEIIKIKGAQTDSDLGPTPFLDEGYIGALINVENNQNYRGISVQLELSNGFTEADFDSILSSMKFTE